MKVRIGKSMAVYTEQLAFMVDVLAPFLQVNEEGANFTIAHCHGRKGIPGLRMKNVERKTDAHKGKRK
jgi:hypothetical protein